MKFSSLLFLGLAALLGGCGQHTDSSSFNPAVAQTGAGAPPIQERQLRYVVPLENRPGEELAVELSVNDGRVQGSGFLSRGNDLLPLEILGEVQGPNGVAPGLAQLRLLPDDIGPSESFDWSGQLSPGSQVTLRQPGESGVYATGTIRDSGNTAPPAAKVWNANYQGGPETYELYVTGQPPYANVWFKMEIEFTEPQFPWFRYGKINSLSSSNTPSPAGSGHPYLSAFQSFNSFRSQTTKTEAEFYLGSPWVKIELQNRAGFGSSYDSVESVLWIRQNENSFFSGGIENEQVSLDPDSYFNIMWDTSVRYEGDRMRVGPGSYLKLLKGGR